MKYWHNILALFLMILIFGCNEPADPPIHPDEWIIPGAENSHMEKIAERGIIGCKVCHGGYEKNDYFGGTSGVSCYNCHAGGQSGHPAWSEWMNIDSDLFHGVAADTRGLDNCRICHGDDLTGGIVEMSCNLCHSY